MIETTYELFNEDCTKFLREAKDKQYQVVVTDPPYGINENEKKIMSRGSKAAPPIDYGVVDWDKERVPDELIINCLRISKQQVIFGGNYYIDLLRPGPSWIVWDKQNSGDFADCELAWTSHNKAVRKFTHMWNGFLKKVPEKRYHPTQKPLALMQWVIENYTELGDTVIDPFMGSGTTGVACVMLGRNFIGIERNERYFEDAKMRIEFASSQPTLLGLMNGVGQVDLTQGSIDFGESELFK